MNMNEFTVETPNITTTIACQEIQHTLGNKKHSTNSLSREYDSQNKWEIGIDEAGRGPMFGRLYVAGVILPKYEIPHPSYKTNNTDEPHVFRYKDIKDSKKFHSPKRIKEMSTYIKQHAIAWHIHYISEQTIDQINIRQSVLRAMQECAKQCIYQLQSKCPEMIPEKDVFLLIDGNDFVSCPMFDELRQSIIEIPHKTFEGGDNTFCSIAAASILAKVARDEYIEQLCIEYPELDVRYGILKNKGYGTKTHLDGIRTHGICEWHRRSYGICKTERMNPLKANCGIQGETSQSSKHSKL
jgi:ribonuclease HII